MWTDNIFMNYMDANYGIIADLSYTRVINRVNSIDASLDSVYNTSLISQLTNYKSILDVVSFGNIELSLNSIYNTSLISQLTAYKNI